MLSIGRRRKMNVAELDLVTRFVLEKKQICMAEFTI